MSGLLALLDDVAALARIAAVQVDDVAAQAAKVGSKAAGVIIDDAAVTPKYVTGLPAARELPIIWQIARGSIFNKLVILLPLALLLSVFAPWMLPPLLMLGGCYLCYEGAEKVLHVLQPDHDDGKKPESLDAAHLEKTRIKSAIKTDFILSAEIMVLSLAAIEADGVVVRGIILAIVAVGITALIYGSVALLVKADDIGLKLASAGQLEVTRVIGRNIVKAMPTVMTLISAIGTAAMLWVGGSIVLHSLSDLGFAAPYEAIHNAAVAVAHAVPVAEGFVEWLVTAVIDGIFGIALGFLLIPLVKYVVAPVTGLFSGGEQA